MGDSLETGLPAKYMANQLWSFGSVVWTRPHIDLRHSRRLEAANGKRSSTYLTRGTGYLDKVAAWSGEEGASERPHGTRPPTLFYALNRFARWARSVDR